MTNILFNSGTSAITKQTFNRLQIQSFFFQHINEYQKHADKRQVCRNRIPVGIRYCRLAFHGFTRKNSPFKIVKILRYYRSALRFPIICSETLLYFAVRLKSTVQIRCLPYRPSTPSAIHPPTFAHHFKPHFSIFWFHNTAVT